ncbi:MAG: extracellular solute-binding protein [Isosphaeraceae bacterium]
MGQTFTRGKWRFPVPLWSGAIVLLCGLAGCGDRGSNVPKAPAQPSFPGVRLAVGVLGDPAVLTGLLAQRGEWIASRHGEISIKEEPVSSLESLSGIDVLIFPGQELGDLADAGLIEAIPNEIVLPSQAGDDQTGQPAKPASPEESPADTFLYDDIAPVFQDQVTKLGSDRLALPLGATALVLAYRRDAFSRPANIAAAREAGIKLEPPATWTQLDLLAKFFQGRDWDGDGKPDGGIAAVLGEDAEGLGNATFLARAAGLGQHSDQYSFLFDSDSMAPRIDSPPFVEALQQTVAWKSWGPAEMSQPRFDAPAARAAFRAGKTALLIDRAERATAWSGGHPVGVAPLPGSERVFEPLRQKWETHQPPCAPSYLPLGGGWLVAVRSGLSGAHRGAAFDLARYLASPENVNRLRAERSFPMLPVRISQMGSGLPDPTSAPDVDSRQWSDAVRRTLQAARVVPGLRIPQASGYLNDLSHARAAALAGKDPAEALHDLAQAWTARTAAQGRKRQLWFYRRSLNSLATLPVPPPRGK